MQSAGNDIVALCGINKERTNNPRFYRQILAVAEQELFHASANNHLSFDVFVWLAWSVKESAYKYFKRSGPQLIFSPTKIIIQHIETMVSPDPATDGYQGSFTFEYRTCYFKSKVTSEFIASIVSDDKDFKGVNWGIRKTNGSDQSKEVRRFLLETLETHFPGKALQVSSSTDQHPVVIYEGKPLELPVSFSHHASFVSFAMLYPGTAPCLLPPAP